MTSKPTVNRFSIIYSKFLRPLYQGAYRWSEKDGSAEKIDLGKNKSKEEDCVET